MSIFGKLFLIGALLLGGANSVWADTVFFGGSIENGWSYTRMTSTGVVSATVTSNVLSNYDLSLPRFYTSDNNITVSSGQTIRLNAKLNGANTNSYSSSLIKVNISTDGGGNWSTVKEFSYNNGDISSDYKELVLDNISSGSYIIQFEFYYATISFITLKDPAETPFLEISPNESAAFGSVTGNSSKTYIISNTGVGKMTVIISSDNEEEFTVSTSRIENIESGNPQSFTVTFHYSIDRLGERSANITLLPTFEGGTPIVISATATSKDPNEADLILDEDNVTNISKLSSQKVLLKYTPTNGWNTFIVPFTPKSYMDAIFGSGWKAYTLTGYTNGTLSFTQQTGYLSGNVPFLVYVENAATHPNGVILEGVSIFSENPSAGKTNQSGAIFQGTFKTKSYQEGDDWYGVTSDGKVMQAGEDAYVKGYRAYFTGISAPANDARPTIVLVDDGGLTDVGFVKMIDQEAKDVYTLSGQKVEKAGRGIYVVNGRKVVIK